MTETAGHNSAARLRSIVERIERLEEERAALGVDIREVYAEAKSAGFMPKVLRALIRERREDADARDDRETILAIYRAALAGLVDTPLGQAAMEKAGVA